MRTRAWGLHMPGLHCIQVVDCIIKFLHDEFNYKYLMNPWQYEHGVCNNDNNSAPQFYK